MYFLVVQVVYTDSERERESVCVRLREFGGGVRGVKDFIEGRTRALRESERVEEKWICEKIQEEGVRIS